MKNRFIFLEKELTTFDVKKRKTKSKKAKSRASNYYSKPISDSFSDTTYVEQMTLPSSGLTWAGATNEQLTFKRAVYDANLARSSRRGTFINDVPSNQLATIEHGKQLRTAAAQEAINMLSAVRAAISSANVNVAIQIGSAYRSASHQFRLWNNYFADYYSTTQSHRQGLEGGEHGQEAINYIGAYIRRRIATPGFSNHNNGLAIDINNTENGTLYRNKSRTNYTDAWRRSWLWDWLTTNAATYHFYQNTAIDEPWHWEYRAPSQ